MYYLHSVSSQELYSRFSLMLCYGLHEVEAVAHQPVGYVNRKIDVKITERIQSKSCLSVYPRRHFHHCVWAHPKYKTKCKNTFSICGWKSLVGLWIFLRGMERISGAVVLPSEELVKEILNLKKISSLSSGNVKVWKDLSGVSSRISLPVKSCVFLLGLEGPVFFCSCSFLCQVRVIKGRQML